MVYDGVLPVNAALNITTLFSAYVSNKPGHSPIPKHIIRLCLLNTHMLWLDQDFVSSNVHKNQINKLFYNSMSASYYYKRFPCM